MKSYLEDLLLKKEKKLKSIDKFFLCIFLLLQVNFFDLINIRTTFLNSVTSYSQKKLLLLLILSYCFIKLLENKKIEKGNTYHFRAFVLILLTTVIAVVIGTVFNYNQGLISTILVAYYFFVLLLYFPLSMEFSDWTVWKDAIRLFMFFSTVYSVLKLMQSFVLLKYGRLIFYLNNNLDYDTAMQLRFNIWKFTRIPSISDFIAISILLMLVYKISIGKVFSNRKDIIVLFVNFICLFVVGQVRGYLILFLLILIFYLSEKMMTRFSRGINSIVGFIILIIGATFAFLVIDKIFSSDSRAISTEIRFSSYTYYLNHLFENDWFSLGFARDDLYYNLIHGTYLNGDGQIISANFDDLGIIGFIGRFGLIGIFDMIVYLIALISSFINSKNKNATILIFVFVFGSCISLSLFDPQRIFYLVFIMALLDFLTMEKSKDKFERKIYE